MKTYIYFLSLSFYFLLTTTGLAQYTQIPDKGFEAFLIQEHIDSERKLDGRVLTKDVEKVRVLVFAQNLPKDIYNLRGLEDFNSLEYLEFSGNEHNHIDTLDLRVVPNLSSCKIERLNSTPIIYMNPRIKRLDYSPSDSTISEIANLQDCSNLEVLSYSHFHQRDTFDVSYMYELRVFNCTNGSFSTIVLPKESKLKNLDCSANKSFKNIDLSRAPDLEVLNCADIHPGTILDISSNLKLDKITYTGNFDLTHNKLLTNIKVTHSTALDVSQNTNLKFLKCDSSILQECNLTNNHNLTSLFLRLNKGSNASLDLSQNRNLYTLILSIPSIKDVIFPDTANDLHYLYLVSFSPSFPKRLTFSYPKVTSILFYEGDIDSLDVSNCPELSSLTCKYNHLKWLNLPHHNTFKELIIVSNPVNSLDLKGCNSLTDLSCSNTLLDTLDLSFGLTKIRKIELSTNALKYLDLRNIKFKDNWTSLTVDGNPDLHCIFVDSKDDLPRVSPRRFKYFVESEAECDSVTAVQPVVRKSPIRIAPNPAEDHFVVTLPSGHHFNRLELYDIWGKVAKEVSIHSGSEDIEVDLSGIPPGLYIVTLQGANGQGGFYVRKVVVR